MAVSLVPVPPLERRAYGRVPGAALTTRLQGRILPGVQVDIVDLSAVGASVESVSRLVPGRRVAMQITAGKTTLVVHARVMRCSVCSLKPGQPARYRGALAFDKVIEEFLTPPG